MLTPVFYRLLYGNYASKSYNYDDDDKDGDELETSYYARFVLLPCRVVTLGRTSSCAMQTPGLFESNYVPPARRIRTYVKQTRRKKEVQ
jgi:hypothetical protein